MQYKEKKLLFAKQQRPGADNWSNRLIVLMKEDLSGELIEKLNKASQIYDEEMTKERGAVPHEVVLVKKGDDALLGSGGFGKVYLGRMESLDLVAIKVPKFSGSTDNIEKTKKKFLEEVRHMNQASHVNVVRVEGFTSYKDLYAMIMEYLPGGNLHDLIIHKDPKGQFLIPEISPSLILRFCADISCGVAYLHSGFNDHRMVHRDIKPANIFLTSDLRCKIGDFGGADFGTVTQKASKLALSKEDGGEFTWYFIALERVKNSNLRWGTAMDVFSVGITFYVVLGRAYPLLISFDQFKPALMEYAARQEGANGVDRELFAFMKKIMLQCSDEESDKRPTMLKVRDDLLRKLRSLDAAAITREAVRIIEVRCKPMPFIEEEDCIAFRDLKVE